MTRIVFLLPTLDIGGAERQVLRTAGALDRRKYDPIVVAFQAGSGRLAAELDAAGVPTVDLGAPRRSPLTAWRLGRWLRAHPCDVLMAYMFHANLASRLVRGYARVPTLICSERVVDWEPSWRVALNRATVGLTDAITTNSRAGVRFWSSRLGVPEARVRLIYNGVDLSRFQPRAAAAAPADGTVVIGNLARLHRKNCHGDLLAALQALASMPDLPPWRCVVAGEGPDAATLAETAARLGLRDRVAFVGHVAQPERFLQSLDVYVQSSMAEGLPNAVLEAMATGVPVVATAVGGTPELVQEGATGLLVPSRDTPRLAQALARLLRDARLRGEMGRAGRHRVAQEFSVERMIQVTEDLLDDLAASRPVAATPRSRVAH